jgi:hypothetical protein
MGIGKGECGRRVLRVRERERGRGGKKEACVRVRWFPWKEKWRKLE